MSDKENKSDQRGRPDARRDISEPDIDPTTGMPKPTPKTGRNSSIDSLPSHGKKMGRNATGPADTTGGSRSRGS